MTTATMRLRDLPQWVCWKYEERGGKTDKVPRNPLTRELASSADPATWATYEEARERFKAGGYEGIGFVFTADDPFCGIDLDKCVQDGEIAPWAQEIVDELDSYTELSPSGTGLHIIVRAELRSGGNRKGQIEMYDRGRFFTITSRKVGRAGVEERQEQVSALHARLFPQRAEPEKPPLVDRGDHAFTDEEIIRRASEAKNGPLFRQLWAGDTTGYESASEADQALANILAFWAGPDAARIESLFGRSGLNREKWKRPDYRRRTIERALSDMHEFFTPGRNGKHGVSGSGDPPPAQAPLPKAPLVLIHSARDLMERQMPPVRWVVPGILPEGVALLAGKPKLGKSWMALGFCISVCAGGRALGTVPVERGSALYLALEDNERRLQSRFRKVLDGAETPPGLDYTTECPRLDAGGLEAIAGWLEAHEGARLVVIDTLAKIRPKAAGKNVYQEDYEALEKLLPLAAKYNVAIVVVAHLRKAAAGDPLDEINASTGLTAGIDGAMILKKDRMRADACLFVTGRDIEEEKEYALRWNADVGSWTLVGDAEEYRASNERAEIVDYLRAIGRTASPKELAQELDKNASTLRTLLTKMVSQGQIEVVSYGQYAVVEKPEPAEPTVDSVDTLDSVAVDSVDSRTHPTEGVDKESTQLSTEESADLQGESTVSTVSTPPVDSSKTPQESTVYGAIDSVDSVDSATNGTGFKSDVVCRHNVPGGCWMCRGAEPESDD